MLGGAGCRRNDLVENELRARDMQFREAVDELSRAESHNDALRRELEAVRSGQRITPEQAALTFGVKRIVLGRGTTGIDNDNIPGDEALQVWLEPRDSEDHAIKAPGCLRVTVQEINSQGQKVELSSWDVDSEKLRQSWKQGLLSVGYQVTFKWQVPPRSEDIRVIAKLTLPDGRTYETDKDIKVRLVPGARSRPETTFSGETPSFKPAPVERSSASIRQVSNWQPVPQGPLKEAIQLGRPMPAPPPTSGDLRFGVIPMLGEIKLDD